MSSYLITGCSRGIGLNLVKQLLAVSPERVGTIIATARSAAASGELASTIESSEGRVHFVSLDVTDAGSIARAVEQVSGIVGDGGLDALVNNAGVQHGDPQGIASMESLEANFATNVVAVHNVTRAFLPLLLLLRSKQGGGGGGGEKKVVNITSTLGSVAMVDSFAASPTAGYKVSKAALNMLTRQWALEHGGEGSKDGLCVFAISPGWLKTDLGSQYADLPPEVGAKATLDIILSATIKDNGRLRNIKVDGWDIYDGKDFPA